jgi:tetratricopeptide (TPR) repeat protein
MKNKIEEIMKMISDDKSDKSNGKVELRQRLSESNSSYSTDSIEHAVSLRNLAINHRAQGRIEEAVVAYEELVQLQRLLLGDSSSDTLESISDLASLYRYRSQYMKAQPLMEECLSAAIQTHGENHVNVVACKNNLANLLADCKKFAEAETLYLSCIVISQEQGGRSAALQYMNNLALLYADQGRVPEARALFEQCLDIGTREYGTDHPVVQGMRNNLRNLSQCRIN